MERFLKEWTRNERKLLKKIVKIRNTFLLSGTHYKFGTHFKLGTCRDEQGEGFGWTGPLSACPPPTTGRGCTQGGGRCLFNITSGDLLKTLWILDFGGSTLKAFYFFFISSKFTKQTDKAVWLIKNQFRGLKWL